VSLQMNHRVREAGICVDAAKAALERAIFADDDPGYLDHLLREVELNLDEALVIIRREEL